MTTIVTMLTQVGIVPDKGCPPLNPWVQSIVSKPTPFWVNYSDINHIDEDAVVDVKLFVGERVLAKDNLFVASLEMRHLRSVGDDVMMKPQINVTVEIENAFTRGRDATMVHLVGNDSNVATVS